MNVTTYFKAQGEGVRLLIIHSTKDALAQQTVNLLKANLKNDILIVEHRIATLGDLAALAHSEEKPNIVLIIAHGDKAANEVWLFGDVDLDGKDIGTNIGLLKTALDGLLDDSLCLFGVCHLGQELLKMAVVDQGGALACVAPKPGCTISGSDIGNEFAKLLNQIQAEKHLPIGVDEIDRLLQETFSADLLNRVAVYTAAS